jgi:hypothetical protein
MSSKLFVSATLLSLALISVGCNSNLSTGHPNTKQLSQTTPKAPAAVNPAAKSTTPTTGDSTLTPDSDIAGNFACEEVENFDHCMADETILISNDFKTLKLAVTGALTAAPTCHMTETATLSAPNSIDANGVVSLNATFANWALDDTGLADSTCTKAFNAWKQGSPATAPISLSVDSSGNVLNYKNGSVNIELTRITTAPILPAAATNPSKIDTENATLTSTIPETPLPDAPAVHEVTISPTSTAPADLNLSK